MTLKEFKRRQKEWDAFHNWEQNRLVPSALPSQDVLHKIGEFVDLYLQKNEPTDWHEKQVDGITELHRRLSRLRRAA